MKLLKKMIQNEEGIALPMALVLLALGGLLVSPMMALVATNLNANIVIDDLDMELYAADAGIENTLWTIKNDHTLVLPAQGEDPKPIYLPAGEDDEVNGKAVTVVVSHSVNQTYKVTSTATSPDGTSTTVESYISVDYFDIAWLFNSAITSPGDITIKPGTVVTGNVTYGGELDNKGTIDGAEISNPLENWPEADMLSAFYLNQAGGLTPFPDASIDISSGTEASPYPIGPLYRIGDLEINGSGWARLDGIVYVTGNFNVQPGCTIDLNGQTIFVDGWINFQPNSTIVGSGCILAVGDVNFQPSLGQSPDDFIFVMSISGSTTLQPNGDYYGSIAGNASVDLQPGNTLELTDVPEDGLNFPGADDEGDPIIQEMGIIDYKIL